MKKILLLLLVCASFQGLANHLKGGFFTYNYLGPGTATGSVRYRVVLTVYMDCGATGLQINNPINFTFFNGAGVQIANPTVSISQEYLLQKGQDERCIEGNQAVCFYKIVVYTLPEIELPASPAGYTVSYQRCCRIPGIVNLSGNSASVGNTYTAVIPGSTLPNGNNSATFQVNDTVVICRNNFFEYSFQAIDPDTADRLSYSFCDAFTGASQSSPAPTFAEGPNSPPLSPYTTVLYSGGFSGASPLGIDVTINPQTGLIRGTAPSIPGEYVVTVCVTETRNGTVLTTTRKELHIIVGDCNSVQSVPAAFDINGIKVEPGVAGCKSFNYSFNNEAAANPLVQTYHWEFSDGATYTTANPSHTFLDTGVYSIKLVLNRGQDCSDSTTTTLKIYPGFFPGFTRTGYCINTPVQFTDTTRTIYGAVNSWRWDFGETTATNDTSRLRNPTYSYPAAGTKNVVFIVTNSVGCRDTVRKNIDILTEPPLTLAFKDTLICNGDSVRLQATGTGVFTWTPAINILNPSFPDPVVFPKTTTPYFVRLDDQGCVANDTVQVRVVDFVVVNAMADTLICQGDSLRLRATTNGLRFLWDNGTTLNDSTLLSPTARPVDNPTVYTLTAFIGPRCFASDNVVVRLTPYAAVSAGNDTVICYNTTAQLNGTTDGTFIGWTPATGLSNANTLTPTAKLRNTTTYVLTAENEIGCTSRDTVTVNVNPLVTAFAGRDTAVVVGQTLQFNATGGVTYQWSPPVALSSTTVSNPKAVYDGGFDSIRYFLTVADSIGCSDDATVLVKVFRTNPRIFVPTAFTPNGDGRNEFVAPIAVGVTKIDYFRVYNRWGQLVFETTVNGRGWDGRIAGQPQSTGTYVWIVKGTDFLGNAVFDKGTVTLIR